MEKIEHQNNVISLARALFFGSIALPYILKLITPHTVYLLLPLCDFFALLTVGATSIFLAVHAARRKRIGWGLLYPLAGLAAVVLYFNLEPRLQRTGEYLVFRVRQSRMEANLDLLGHPLTSADSLRLRHTASDPAEQAWYDADPAGILVCTTGGEASNMYWGYAFSPTGKKPSYTSVQGEVVEWRQLANHWYFWLSIGG